MAAEVARAAGAEVTLYERMGSVGRKFLLAGKGGLNLTHSEPFAPFLSRYGDAAPALRAWLQAFDAEALRRWARELGIDTVVGSSGRVFPADFKAAPLLRGWVRRLRQQGVQFAVGHRLSGWTHSGAGFVAEFETEAGLQVASADALILALGGGSWPQLGSDGRWTELLAAHEVPLSPLRPSNCGFSVPWSEVFARRHAGQPIKPVVLHWADTLGHAQQRQGELIVTEHGLEGGLIYAASASLRNLIERDGEALIHLDLLPGKTVEALVKALSLWRGKRSLSEHLRRAIGVSGVCAGLLYEVLPKEALSEPARIAATLKYLPLRLSGTRPLAEAISTAGGVRLDALNEHAMLTATPGLFCAGEMLDWEAPTGGYLLTASFASGRAAAVGACSWLGIDDGRPSAGPASAPRPADRDSSADTPAAGG
jgi:uncharacterized flavoprotein (TIGR03862 family)